MQKAESEGRKKTTAGFDYREIERRLAAAQAEVERGGIPTLEERRRVLASRAQALAMARSSDEPAEAHLEIVEFHLASERYAIQSRYVREVHPLECLTPVPCTPPHVLGIVNLRGEIISVIDIRVFFDLPAQGLPDLSKLMVLESQDMCFGVLVDGVDRVSRVRSVDIQSTLTALTQVRKTYLLGLTADRLAILDGGKLLSDQQIIVQEEISDR